MKTRAAGKLTHVACRANGCRDPNLASRPATQAPSLPPCLRQPALERLDDALQPPLVAGSCSLAVVGL